MSVWVPGYDSHKGRQHNLHTILESHLFEKSVQFWAKILVFDAVIGNVDRHQDNWGTIWTKVRQDNIPKKMRIKGRMAPAFDNGTALSYEIIEPNFYKFSDPTFTHRYLTKPDKARHHMRWSLDETGDMNFFAFMRRFFEEFPEERGLAEQMLGFTRETIEARLSALPLIDVPEIYKLTRQRLDFTIDMLMKRKELLEKAIEVH